MLPNKGVERLPSLFALSLSLHIPPHLAVSWPLAISSAITSIVTIDKFVSLFPLIGVDSVVASALMPAPGVSVRPGKNRTAGYCDKQHDHQTDRQTFREILLHTCLQI